MADVLKGPPLAHIRMRGRVEAAEVALKPLKSPPLACVWTRGRWWCCRDFGCHRDFTLSFCSGGEVSDLSGNGRIDDENEP